jgi:hypothetical protein
LSLNEEMTLQSSRLQVFITAAILSWSLCGCHDRATDFTPSRERAEAALAHAMAAWQAGRPTGELSESKPVIHVTDNHLQRKRGLEKYRILGETVARSGRTFIVELTLKSPEEKVKTEYIVVGIDPLWVFRREDYDLLMHWDHRMPESSPETEKP